MGSWFSNLHIRKKDSMTVDMVPDYICRTMASQQYTLTSSEDEADGAFAIISNAESQWYSVYSDLLSFEEPNMFSDYAAPLSTELETDILGISCFDSDYLYLNLIDAPCKKVCLFSLPGPMWSMKKSRSLMCVW